MPSRRRSRNKNLKTNISDVQRRLRYLERRPVRTSLSGRVVSREAISPRSVGPEEADFGVTIMKPPGSETNWEAGLPNPTDGDLIINPDDGSSMVYDETTDSFITLSDPNSVTTYYQTDAPASATSGDLWFDTDDGFKLYRYDGSTWVSVQDSAISAAYAAANAAQNTANGKNRIYRQPAEPTGGSYVAGDVWFDTDSDNTMYRYATSSSSTVAFKSLTNNVATLVTSSPHSFVPLEQITVTGVDSVFNGTYTVTAVPTTTSLRYAKTNANVANTSTSGTITNTDGWKVALLGDNALVSIGATKITAGTLDVGVIYAGNINTNQISAGTLNVGVIYAGQINTSQINAGTLNAGVVYAGQINVGQINAGTLNAGTVKISTSPGGSGARVELDGTGLKMYNASNVATVNLSSGGTASFTGTITGSTFTTTNYPSGNGTAIGTGTNGNALLFNVAGTEIGTIATVAGGTVITSGFSQLVMSAAGAVVLGGLFNSLTFATAPYLSTSGSNIGGAYGSVRNIWANTVAPTNPEGNDGDLWFVWT
jgi:hypothetical protein